MNKLFQQIRDPQVIRYLIGVTIGLLLVGGFIYLRLTLNRVFVEDSLVQAQIVNVSPTAPGKLTETYVTEGETVKRGDPLAAVGTDTLRADSDGLIIMASDQIGSLFSAQAPVVQMIDPAKMRIAATIDENKGLNLIKVGQSVSFTVDALPGQTFWGYVDEISPSAKQTQLSFSISSERPIQQFIIYVRYDASRHPEIKNGMSAKITVFTKTP